MQYINNANGFYWIKLVGKDFQSRIYSQRVKWQDLSKQLTYDRFEIERFGNSST